MCLLTGEELYKSSNAKSKRKFREYREIDKFDDYDVLNEEHDVNDVKVDMKSPLLTKSSSLDEDEDEDDPANISRIMQATDYYEYKEKVAVKSTNNAKKNLHVINEDEDESPEI